MGGVRCQLAGRDPARTRQGLQARGMPLAAIAISPAKVVRLRPLLPILAALFMNEAEALALTGEPVVRFPIIPSTGAGGCGRRLASGPA